MKLTIASTTLAFAAASANPHFMRRDGTSGGSFTSWTPPTDSDCTCNLGAGRESHGDSHRGSNERWLPFVVRGPCPMMNTLANHAFLPHNGSGITLPVLTAALGDALNFDAALAATMFQAAIIANPEPNATEFSL